MLHKSGTWNSTEIHTSSHNLGSDFDKIRTSVPKSSKKMEYSISSSALTSSTPADKFWSSVVEGVDNFTPFSLGRSLEDSRDEIDGGGSLMSPTANSEFELSFDYYAQPP